MSKEIIQYFQKNNMLKKFLLIFLISFVFGIVLGITISAQNADMKLFSDSFIEKISNVKINTKSLLNLLIKRRIVILFVLFIFGFSRAGKTISNLFLIWNGCCFGILLSNCIRLSGAKGCLAMLFFFIPQFVFYIPAMYLAYNHINIIGSKCLNTRMKIKKEHFDFYVKYIVGFIFVLLLVFAGILCETYINPLLVKNIVKIL